MPHLILSVLTYVVFLEDILHWQPVAGTCITTQFPLRGSMQDYLFHILCVLLSAGCALMLLDAFLFFMHQYATDETVSVARSCTEVT